ncbi:MULTISPECIES: TIGR03619 family F420-dependent LLM class oxidoreductase [unclassified Amycolatopsis]|uniref:TIGR03619 family F420-dependent LLM class oxidoreductase n=1 Tax=unclassified Amycolatopsis TaxID=2618356 RepID=UPI0034538A95
MSPTAPVRIGLALPHDVPGDRRALVTAAQDAGYRYLTLADHVVGADTTHRPGWTGRYTAADPFREVFVHLGHVSALTTLELVPSVVVLPQRQTAVVAKQTAELALLSRGGVRLGVGVGWNAVEFEALGATFGTRAERMEEQIAVLRLLWSRRAVSFDGRYHRLDAVGVAPLPPEPIPLWLGGGLGKTEWARERVRRRVVALGDGWITAPQLAPEQLAPAVSALRECAERADRDPASLGIQATLVVGAGDDDATLRAKLAHIRAAAPTHLTVDCRGAGRSAAEHVEISTAAAALISNEL